MQVNLNQVYKVYSGKRGCMCGCLGNYRYPSSVDREAYKAQNKVDLEDEDISDRSVKIIANKVINHPNVKVQDNIMYVEENGRIKAVYFKKNIEKGVA